MKDSEVSPNGNRLCLWPELALMVKNDGGPIPGSERSPGGGHGNPL